MEQSRKTKRPLTEHSILILLSVNFLTCIGHWYINAVDTEVFAHDQSHSGSYHPTFKHKNSHVAIKQNGGGEPVDEATCLSYIVPKILHHL